MSRNALYLSLFYLLLAAGSLRGQEIPDLDSIFAKRDLAGLDLFISGWHAHSDKIRSALTNEWSAYQQENQPALRIDSASYSEWLRKNSTSPHHLSVRMAGATQLIRRLSSALTADTARHTWLVIPLTVPVEFAASAFDKTNNTLATEFGYPHPLLYAKNALLLDRTYDSLLCNFLEKGITRSSAYALTAAGSPVHERIAFLNQRLHVSIDTLIRNHVYLVHDDLPQEFDPYVQQMRRAKPYCLCPELWVPESIATIRRIYVSADGKKASVLWSTNSAAPVRYFFDARKRSWMIADD